MAHRRLGACVAIAVGLFSCARARGAPDGWEDERRKPEEPKVRLSAADAKLPASAGAPLSLPYPPTFHTVDASTLRERTGSFSRSGFRVELNRFGFVIRAAMPTERRSTRVSLDQVHAARDLIAGNREAFGLGPAMNPEVVVENGHFSFILWTQHFATTDLSISLNAEHISGDTPAGPGYGTDRGYEVVVDRHLLSIVDFPAEPARKTDASLLAPYLGRALVFPGPSQGTADTPIVEKVTTAGTTAFHGVFLRVTDETLEVHDVVHFALTGPFHTEDGREVTSAALGEKEKASDLGPLRRQPRPPRPRSNVANMKPLGIFVDARTGEDLSDTPPWRSVGWFSFRERARPFNVNQEGFFAANVPFPRLKMASTSPPP
jgi:hypothetical protein